MSRKSELIARIESCPYCSMHSEEFCDRHQGMVDELPVEYVVRCADCGEMYTSVPEKGKVECFNCDKILKKPVNPQTSLDKV